MRISDTDFWKMIKTVSPAPGDIIVLTVTYLDYASRIITFGLVVSVEKVNIRGAFYTTECTYIHNDQLRLKQGYCDVLKSSILTR